MHAILFIPAAQKVAANALMLALFGGTGDNFTIGLNADGVDTKAATQYWCAIQARPQDLVKITAFTNAIPGATAKTYDLIAQKTVPWDQLSSKGLMVKQKPLGTMQPK